MDPECAVALLADRQHGLVSRPQAIRCGLSTAGVSRRLQLGHWERLHQGVYRLAGSGRTLDQQILAACLAAGGRALASHCSAAYLLGLPVEHPTVEITVGANRRVGLGGVTVHRSRDLQRVDTLVVRGIPATSAARTLIDLASVLPTRKLEDVLDHALANRLIPVRYLTSRLVALRSGRDGAAALAALLRARPTGRRPRQSEAERILLEALRSQGVRLPAVQVPISLAGGRWAYPDLCYQDERLIVEVDSYVHHSSLSDWEDDHLRNRDLVAMKWRILPLTAAEIRASPAAAAETVREALGAERSISAKTKLAGVISARAGTSRSGDRRFTSCGKGVG